MSMELNLHLWSDLSSKEIDTVISMIRSSLSFGREFSFTYVKERHHL
jgi:hypothetical protein